MVRRVGTDPATNTVRIPSMNYTRFASVIARPAMLELGAFWDLENVFAGLA